ncbi:hypothetical protein Hypma_011845 [Hypsizygus marmoreus]|uniref:Uncharacterized protein n=1 Tax=Hypsizygus marmoreus TaxID=39966 RepID=A0A369JGX1_HYPMA|nr:hypothetical protein Hypma_011845 [Hypsizygus marmoreus]
MRVSIASLTLFTLLSSFTSKTLASPSNRCVSEYCPGKIESRGVPMPAVVPTRTSELTNGERLAQGLPIKPPTRRSRGPKHPTPSPLPQHTKRGVIKVTESKTGAFLGYISKHTFGHAQYRYQPKRDDALVVEFKISIYKSFVTNVRLTAEDSNIPDFPLLSLIEGHENHNADLAPGSFHYAYIGGMAEPGTPPKSVPMSSPENSYSASTGYTEAAESDVWSFDAFTNHLVPRWTNWDGSRPAVHIFEQATAIYISGDVKAFKERFPAPVKHVTLEFVPL